MTKTEIISSKAVDFKVREEFGGGLLFRRREGSATRLSANEIELLKTISVLGNISHPDVQNVLATLFPLSLNETNTWLDSLKNEGFSNNDGSLNARFVFPEQPLPKECLTAPSRIYLELTRACNLRCKTCLNSSGNPLKNELSFNEWKNTLDEIDKMGTFEIRLTGGEPTVHPHFLEIVEHAKNLGLYISLATNGIYSKDLRPKILSAGIDWFRVSLDGPEEENDLIRGKGSFRQTIQTIKEISENTNARLTISIVLGRYNFTSLRPFVETLSPYRIESISTLPLRPTGRATHFLSGQMLTRNEWSNLAHEVSKLRSEYGISIKLDYDVITPERDITKVDRLVRTKYSCAAGIEGACIAPNGDFYGCGYSPASDPNAEKDKRSPFLAGNIREHSIIRLWRDSSRWKLFRNL